MTSKKEIKDRQRNIAAILCITQDSVDVKALAEKYGVAEQTIYKDLRSETLADYVIDEVKSQMKGEGIAKAWDNIKRAIIKGDIPTSRWLLEKLEVFREGSIDEWDNLLRDLYAASDNGQDAVGDQSPDNGEDTATPR